MNKLDKVIKTTKSLIDLPYNLFNLENYYSVLHDNKLNPITIETQPNQPIKLMSGGNFYSKIVTSNMKYDKKPKIYIVGKGILFDSGGLDLKPPDGSMCAMTDDKAGMVIAMNVANYLKGNVVAFCPVTTNFIYNSKITPGDIIPIGKHKVRVTDTDAEGRLILAEAISALDVSKDDIIISIATLTGGCPIAIGDKATAILSDNDDLLRKYAEASFEAKSLSWALPMFDYMNEYYKEEPIRNWIKEFKGSTCQGGTFIKQFCKYPNNFIHLDIAASAFGEDGKANGQPIETLVKFIKKLQ